MEEITLTVKQKKFADEYIKTGNAYRSAVNAGYSENYSKGNVVKLLENVSVKTYLNKRMKKIASEQIADATEVLKYLTRVIRCEELEKDIEGNSSPPKISERTKAAELLGKRYALFTENIEHKGDIGIKVEWTGNDED